MVSLPFLKSDMIPTPPFVWEKYEKTTPPPLIPLSFSKRRGFPTTRPLFAKIDRCWQKSLLTRGAKTATKNQVKPTKNVNNNLGL